MSLHKAETRMRRLQRCGLDKRGWVYVVYVCRVCCVAGTSAHACIGYYIGYYIGYPALSLSTLLYLAVYDLCIHTAHACTQCRARTWLFFAYVVATAAVATGVVLLVKQADNLEHAAVV